MRDNYKRDGTVNKTISNETKNCRVTDCEDRFHKKWFVAVLHSKPLPEPKI